MTKAKNPFLQTRTIDGVKVTVDTRAFEDMRFFRTFTRLMELDEEQGDGDEGAGRDYIALLDTLDQLAAFVFGDQVERYQKAIADQHGGFISYQDWLGFITRTITTFQKNSDARPADSGQ